MIAIILLNVLRIYSCDAWSGIVLDGSQSGRGGGTDGGNTQLYVPGNPPTNTPNINFGLSHQVGQAAVMFNERAYFIGGGYPTAINNVTIFNPSTNTSTTGS